MSLFKNKIVATDIETETWYKILEGLKSRSWTVISEYKLFDKGIDYDAYYLKKGKDKLDMQWDNWAEGEIKGSPEILDTIQSEQMVSFVFNDPVHFKKYP